MKRLVFIVVALTILSGCSSFNEVYHFKATEGDTVNYYRTTVSGWTFFSASQYAAGNYDAEAVDALFGELKGAKINVDSTKLVGYPQRSASGGASTSAAQPGSPSPATTSSSSGTDKNAAKVETLSGESLAQKKFVFFLSSNSDFFVNQINTYVTTRDMQRSIVTLILKDDIGRLYEARSKRDAENASAEALAAQLRAVAARVKAPVGGTLTNKSARDEVVGVLKALAMKGNTMEGVAAITNMDDGTKWLQNHPGAFTGVNP